MLTGTLVTAAGFLPVGFADSSTGEYAGGMFWVLAIALLASWLVAVVFTPYLGVKLLPDFGKPHAHADPRRHLSNAASIARLRGVIAGAVDHRGLVVAATVGVFVVAGARLSRHRAAAVLSDLGAAGAVFPDAHAGGHAPSARRWRRVKQAETLLNGDADIATYHQLCRPGLAALLAGPQSRNCRTKPMPRSSIVAKDLAGARADQAEDRDALSPRAR